MYGTNQSGANPTQHPQTRTGPLAERSLPTSTTPIQLRCGCPGIDKILADLLRHDSHPTVWQPAPTMHAPKRIPEMHPRHSEHECLSDREYRLQRGNQPLHTPSLAAPAMHLEMLTAQSTRAKGELDNGTIVAQASHAPARSHPLPGFWSTATASQTGYGLPHKQHSHSRLSAATSANTASILKTRRS